MDLERIKQNFRIRSGRSKKVKKTKRSPEAENGIVAKATELDPNPTAAPAPTPALQSTTPEVGSTSNGARESEKTEVQDQEKQEEQDHEEEEQEGAREGEVLAEGHAEKPPTDAEDTVDEELGAETSEPQVTSTPKENESQAMTDAYATASSGEDFDLSPPSPTPRAKPLNLETVAELLFSSSHLDHLLHNPAQLTQFSAFLQRYLPQSHPYLAQYLETQKAIKAVEYANAISEGLKAKNTADNTINQHTPYAAELNADFKQISDESFSALVGHALPTYISYLLVKVVSECLTNELTGRSTPMMRDLVGGLSEVFCLTDPNREDNPIIYASEEFYRLTKYGPNDVINSNCRFLQGRKTDPKSPKRLKDAIKGGQEISEALLNYRRDGSPFINLLMIAPLHDRHGKLKYHIGAQVDVTGLVMGGRALTAFQKFLDRRAEDARRDEALSKLQPLNEDQKRKKHALAKLRDLSDMFDLEESAVVQAHSRSNSLDRDDDDIRSVTSLERPPRRMYVDSDASEDEEDDNDPTQNGDGNDLSKWKLGSSGDGRLSGKLPGVYDSFMLLRPAPSLRIVFVSPKLRRLGQVLQTPFMSHVTASQATLTGLNESLKSGVPVSAKIHFSPQRLPNRTGEVSKTGTRHEDGKHGRAIWISCTPMLGDDDKIGVWMCVILEKAKAGSSKRNALAEAGREVQDSAQPAGQANGRNLSKEKKDIHVNGSASSIALDAEREGVPIRPVRVHSRTNLVTVQQEEVLKSTSAKNLQSRQSVYFDSSTKQDSQGEEEEEREQEDEKLSSLDAVSQDQSVHPDKHVSYTDAESLTYGSQAMTPSVEEYEAVTRISKPYSARIPGLDHDFSDDDVDDQYITIRSPQVKPLPKSRNERVLIEEDSDAAEDEGLDHYHENIEVGSSFVEYYRTGKADTALSDHMEDSEIPPSIPASAYLPDEDEASIGPEAGIEAQTRTETRVTKPAESKNDVTSGEVADEADAKPSEVVLDAIQDDSADHHAQSLDMKASNQTVEQDQEPKDEEQRPAEEQRENPDVEEEEPDRETESTPDEKQEKSEEAYQDKDSAISMQSSAQPRHLSPSASPQPSRSTDLSPAFHSVEIEPELKHDDYERGDERIDHVDIEHWMADGQQSAGHEGHTAMNMDYLQAGSSRWHNARPPPLQTGKEVLDNVNDDRRWKRKNGDMHSDGNMTDDFCIGSPYSVD